MSRNYIIPPTVRNTGKAMFEVTSLDTRRAGTTYHVNLKERTCDCPAYQLGITRPCKHIVSVESENQ